MAKGRTWSGRPGDSVSSVPQKGGEAGRPMSRESQSTCRHHPIEDGRDRAEAITKLRSPGWVYAPTMLQTTLLGAVVKRGEVDLINSRHLVHIDFDLFDQSSDDLATRQPVRLIRRWTRRSRLGFRTEV